MARSTPKKATDAPIHHCIDCANGTPDMRFENLSLNGQPTLIACPYHKYKLNINQLPCNNFTPKKV